MTNTFQPCGKSGGRDLAANQTPGGSVGRHDVAVVGVVLAVDLVPEEDAAGTRRCGWWPCRRRCCWGLTSRAYQRIGWSVTRCGCVGCEVAACSYQSATNRASLAGLVHLPAARPGRPPAPASSGKIAHVTDRGEDPTARPRPRQPRRESQSNPRAASSPPERRDGHEVAHVAAGGHLAGPVQQGCGRAARTTERTRSSQPDARAVVFASRATPGTRSAAAGRRSGSA